jgi:hypothetical protein
MRNWILVTSLAAMLAAEAVFAQSPKTSLPKATALSKAFRPNASKAENLEAMRRTLGISSSSKLEWIPGINAVDTLSVIDDFNRGEVGTDWAYDEHLWEIKDGELVLKPEAISEWRYLITYLPIYNNLERRLYAVSYRWGKNADALGIREGAHAIMMDRPSNISTGYWIWHRNNWGEVWMWVIKDGTWEAAGTPGNPEGLEIDKAKSSSFPVAGDVVKVVIRPEKTANYFDYYVNNKLDATVKDDEKRFPPSSTWYVGLFIHGQNLNNQVDDFKVTWLQGDGFTPAAVSDLTVTKATTASVTLEWTAPGDNGFEGRAKSYNIRYSTNHILTDADFAAASPVPDPITPGPGGSTDRLVIAGLQSGKTYYFALKTTDEAGNVSDLSNEVSARLPALLLVSDNFNRANGGLGSAWAGDLANLQIRNNAVQNVGAAGSWSAVVYQNARNIIEASLQYAPTATVRGVGASGILLLANAPTGPVNGYMIQHDNGADLATNADDMTRLWIVQNGRPDQLVEEGRSHCGFSPKAGSKITTRIIDIDDERYFYVYVDGVFDRVLKDDRKTFNGLYAGFMVDGGAGDQSAIDEFSAGAAPGTPKALSIISGDGQFGEIGKTLPLPLTVSLIDSFNNPLAGVYVRFAVTSGAATIPPPESPDGNLRLEAEDAQIVGPLAKVKDSEAAFGQFIVYPSGQTADASATFTFNIAKPGAYRVWTRSMKTGTQPGSWSVQVDNGPTFVYDVFEGQIKSFWKWDLLTDRNTAPQYDPKIINFTAGEHRLIFHARWEDTRLDKIIITADPDFLPDFKEESGFFTDFSGQASATLRLGMTLQPVVIEASHGNVKPVTFKITPISNEKPTTITAIGGASQSGSSGQTLQPFKVILKDKNGNGVAGQQVAWVVTAGNGTLSQYTSSTNLDGVAQTTLTLGNISATNTVEARATLVSGSGKQVFNATTTSGLAAKVAVISGNGQSGTVHAALPTPLLVKVTSSDGQAVRYFPVEFKILRGGGSLSPNPPIKNGNFEDGSNVPTNWSLVGGPIGSEVSLTTIGPKDGTKSLQVNANRDGVGISQTVNFTHGPYFTLSFYAKVLSGTIRVVVVSYEQEGTVPTPITKSVDITSAAAGGNWVFYTISVFNTIGASGSLMIKTLGSGNFMIDDIKFLKTTDLNGQISVNWTLGDTAMTQVVRAEAKAGNTVLAGSPITFSATAKAGAAKKLVAVSGNNQNGGQDQFLNAPLTARVSDDYVNGIPGRNVTFTVKSGDAKLNGNVSSLTVTSDAGGLAKANLKLGPAAKDTIKVEASSSGLKPVIFNAIAAVPSKVTKVPNPPTTGSAGIRLSKPLAVRVADALGKPISGYPVLFTVTQGGGHFNGKTQTTLLTDSTGQARAFPTLGTVPGGQNRFQAVINYNGQTLPAQPITFAVRAAGLKAMTAVSGGGQTGNTCEPLAQPFKVKVVDSLNVGVKGQTVKFAAAAGNGSFNGVNPKEVLTDSLGIAAATLTLGEKPVANQVTASMKSPLSGSPQTFTATAQLGKASVLRKVSGDSLTGPVNAVLSTLLAVRVTDKCAANGITGIPVTFIVKAGSGKVNGKDTVTVVSGADGKAQVSWKLGPLAGKYNNRVEAKAALNNAPLANSPQIFVASATASGARSMNIKAGNQQRGRAGETLPNPLVVRVIDGSNGIGNAVAGHRVRFTITRGGGKFTTGSKDTTVNTDANGEAKIFWTLGGAVGTNAQEVRATATNSAGGNLENSPLIFTANVNGSDPSAEGTVFEVNSPTPVPADGATKCKVTVYVRDRFGNPVQGLAVTFIVSGGPNVIEQPDALTDSLGRAACRFSSIRAEVKTVTAKILGGIDLTNGTTVTFVPTAARNISLVTGNGQACNVKAALPNPLKVKVGDQFNNGVANYEVRFIVKGEGRILESGPIKTDAAGVANARFIAGANTGQTQIWAEAPGLTNSPVIFVAAVTKTPAQRMIESSGNAQRGPVNQELPEPLVVRITDGFGRPVFGVPVKVLVTFGGGSVSREDGSSQLFSSDELGEVRAKWRLGPAAGINSLRFEVDGLAGSPIDFRAEATADVAAILEGSNCGSVSGPVGGTTPQPLTVRVTDASGNGVDGVEVLFELLQGTGSFSSREQIRVVQMMTSSGGFAATPITFGNESGYRRVRVSAEGLAGSPMTCQVYGRSLAAQTMEAILRTNNQRGTKGKPLNFPLQVLVKDRLGNPVPNENLSFLITSGGGDFNGVTPFTARTDSQGVASALWTLGRFAAGNEATVVRNGLLPSTLVFKATGYDNNFPVFAEVPDRRVTEGDVIEFQLSATDADGEALKYGAKNLPSGAQFDSLGTRVFRWATDPDSEGHYEVSFFARDPRGGADEELVGIEVKNRNQRPIIYSRIPAGHISSSLPDTTLEIVNGVGTMLMRVNAIDPDGDALSYRWFVNGKYAGSATNTFFFRSGERFSSVEALVFDQEDTSRTQWMVKVPVQLSSFSASLESGMAAAGKHVTLRWSTASESNNVGFNLIRSRSLSGRYDKINRQLIAPRHDGQYVFVDNDVEADGKYFYKLQDIDWQGNVTEHGPVSITVASPESYVLQQNYPNPFNPATLIRYELPKAGHVSLIIYNSLGQEVRRLVDKQQAAGYHDVTWNGRDQNGKPVPSGVYHYRLQVGDFVAAKRMLMAK